MHLFRGYSLTASKKIKFSETRLYFYACCLLALWDSKSALLTVNVLSWFFWTIMTSSFWRVLFDRFFLTIFFRISFLNEFLSTSLLTSFFKQVFYDEFFWAGVSPKISDLVYETPFRRGFRNLYIANESDTWILSHFRSILESICTKGKWLSIYLSGI